MKFKIKLLERLSPIIYHLTWYEPILKILETNKIMTSVAAGTSADLEQNRGKFYYLSTTRSLFSKYTGTAYLVLDGEKLNQRYRGSAIDYWGRGFDRESDIAGEKLKRTEMEDRLITDKPYIDNAVKYIKSIHIKVNDPLREKFYGKHKEIQELAEEKGIPIYFYTNEKLFLFGKKGEPILADLNIEVKPETYDDNYERRVRQTYLTAFADIITMSDEDLINMKTTRPKYPYTGSWGNTLYKQIKNGYNIGEIQTQLSNDIHNEKSNAMYREYIDKIVQYMRRYKLRDIKSFLNHLHNKWKDNE